MMVRHASFYAVARGRSVGVFTSWAQCRMSVDGFSGCVFKKFPTMAEATEFVEKRRIGPSTAGIGIDKSVHPIGKSTKIRKQTSSVDLSGTSSSSSASSSSYSSTTDPSAVIVYTDGACSRNGFVGAKAGYGVFWGTGHVDNVSAPIHGAPTNNRAEYMAVITALEKALERQINTLIIRTDSALLIQSITKWMFKWRKNGWKTVEGKDVRNRDLLERMDGLMKRLDVRFEKVAGHSGDFGNDQADLLARQGAEQYVIQNRRAQ